MVSNAVLGWLTNHNKNTLITKLNLKENTMEVVLTIIGILVGGVLGYWWRSRSTKRDLPQNAVWLFQPKGQKVSLSIWKVSLVEEHNLWDGEPLLWKLPVHEHPFTLQDKHSYCFDQERINISCTIKVKPQREVDYWNNCWEKPVLTK